MLNKVWFWLVLVGIVYGFGKGAYQEVADRRAAPAVDQPTVDQVDAAPDSDEESEARGLVATGERINKAALEAATVSVELCIGLIGIMALWLGLLQVAHDAGLVESVARLLRPIIRWLFPEVPDGHPAQGAIVMNLSANMLGLENAATPMGLKAMQELQKLNPTPDTATNSMAMFLAINTSNVTLIPFTIIGYRALYGSENPTQPLMGTLLVTSLATVVAIFAANYFSKLPRYRADSVTGDEAGGEPSDTADREGA